MATTISQPTFGLHPPADDTMEISSDAGQMDADIDIDFDQDEQQLHYEDHQMLDDAKSDIGTVVSMDNFPLSHVNDDIMIDDDVGGDLAAETDGMMHEVAHTDEHDEELLDFSDAGDDYAAAQLAQDVTRMEPGPLPPPSIDLHQPEDHIEHAQGNVQPLARRLSLSAAAMQREIDDSQDEITYPEEDFRHVPGVPEILPHETTTEEKVEVNEEDSTVQLDTGYSEIPHENSAHAPSKPVTDEEVAVHKSTIAQDELSHGPDSNVAAAELEAPGHREDAQTRIMDESRKLTGLHTTIVVYQGSEVSLFPSGDPASTEQYFLENENLVNASIGDLLQACRGVLGESLSEDDELELGVDDLELYVSEDSTPAFSTSFKEILDVYVQLQRNDGVEQPPPLYVTLTTKTRFTHRLTLLTQAMSEGKGLSQIPVLHDSISGDEDFNEEHISLEDEESQHSHAEDEEGETADNETEQYEDQNGLEQQRLSPTNDTNDQAAQVAQVAGAGSLLDLEDLQDLHEHDLDDEKPSADSLAEQTVDGEVESHPETQVSGAQEQQHGNLGIDDNAISEGAEPASPASSVTIRGDLTVDGGDGRSIATSESGDASLTQPSPLHANNHHVEASADSDETTAANNIIATTAQDSLEIPRIDIQTAEGNGENGFEDETYLDLSGSHQDEQEWQEEATEDMLQPLVNGDDTGDSRRQEHGEDVERGPDEVPAMDDGFDEIDFDDEDVIEDEVETQAVDDKTSLTAASPNGSKRKWADQADGNGFLDDGLDLKRRRPS